MSGRHSSPHDSISAYLEITLTLQLLFVQEHIRMGQAIAPLRDEGVLLFGSGLSYHSMRGFSRNGTPSHASAASKAGSCCAPNCYNGPSLVLQKSQMPRTDF